MGRALGIEASLIAIAAVVGAATTVGPGSAPACALIILMAFAMGVRNAAVKHLAVPDLTTTVLTMTLTGLAAESPPAGGFGKGSIRRGAAVLSMLAGALCGALLLKASLFAPLALASALALATWLVTYRLPRASRGARPQRKLAPRRPRRSHGQRSARSAPSRPH